MGVRELASPPARRKRAADHLRLERPIAKLLLFIAEQSAWALAAPGHGQTVSRSGKLVNAEDGRLGRCSGMTPRTDARLAADAAGAERSCVGADPFECVGERFDVGVGEVLGKVSLDSVSVVAAGAL
jgi:hypothetical protein